MSTKKECRGERNSSYNGGLCSYIVLHPPPSPFAIVETDMRACGANLWKSKLASATRRARATFPFDFV